MLRLLESQRVRPRSRTLPPPSSLSLVPLARPPAPRRTASGRPAPRAPGVLSRPWRQSPVERRARRGRSLLGRRLDRRPDRQPRVRRAGPPARLRLPKRLPLEAVLAAAIVAVLLAFLWSRQPLRRDPLLLPADAAGAALAYEASLAADEPEPPPEAPGLSPPPDRLPQRVLESLKVAAYEVKAGDTISTIAGRFSLNLDTLLSYNDVRDVRRLTAGRVLKVPNSDGLKHRVSRGRAWAASPGGTGSS